MKINNNIIKYNIFVEKHIWSFCYPLYKNIHTYVASSTPFPLNIHNFANFTNASKSFYTDISESIHFEKM